MGLNFNPRSPDGERRFRGPRISSLLGISIHAPRMGSDEYRQAIINVDMISIHAPRMGSDDMTKIDAQLKRFQSTLPGWGATWYAQSADC